jgi:hypothetical protein
MGKKVSTFSAPKNRAGTATMKQLLICVLGVSLLTGCGASHVAVSPAARAQVAAGTRAQDNELSQDVVKGYTQIFKTYDVSPKDGRLSLAEFSHVVTREWFVAHDTNHDHFIPLDEWLTPSELRGQIEAITSAGNDLVAHADKNGDHKLSLAEYLGYDNFEIDPTPWLDGPADAQIKTDDFNRFADAAGQLEGASAARMIGALLAKGYYLDSNDPSVAKLRSGLPKPKAF